VTNPSGCQAESTVTVTFNFAACSGINDPEKEYHCSLYPNPGDGNIQLIFDKDVRQAEISIVDLTGRRVWGPRILKNLSGNPDEKISLENKSEGIYLVKILYSDRGADIFKFILKNK
jgi:hypothetical protein